MAETAVVPAEWFAIFQHDTLPGHPANPGTDNVIDWPLSPSGVAFMPMSGKFLVRDSAGALAAREDGFLTVGADGHPVWSATVPD